MESEEIGPPRPPGAAGTEARVPVNGDNNHNQPTPSGAPSTSTSTSTTNNGSDLNANHQLQLLTTTNHASAAARDTEDPPDDVDGDGQHIYYTYRGGSNSRSLADLPASFYQFDSLEFAGASGNSSSCSNPMTTASMNGLHHSDQSLATANTSTSASMSTTTTADHSTPTPTSSDDVMLEYLEMDFDPGPEHEPNEPPNADAATREEPEPVLLIDVVGGVSTSSMNISPQPSTSNSAKVTMQAQAQASTSIGQVAQNRVQRPLPMNLSMRLVKSNTLPRMGVGSSSSASCMSLSSQVTTPTSSSGSSFTPILRTAGLSYSTPLMLTARSHDADAQNNDENSTTTQMQVSPGPNSINFDISELMIWTREEAIVKSFNQLGTSACGATAVLNALTALGVGTQPEIVTSMVPTRLRLEHAELPEYLQSRSVAGTTADDLVQSIHKLTGQEVYAKFCPISARCTGSEFCNWLLHWICRGAIPIATRNMQVFTYHESACNIPDAWHHQMIFGLGPGGIHLCNPVECVPVEILLPQLTSDSVLLIRREDIVSRVGPRTDLRRLARIADSRWGALNVLGQVGNMLHEQLPVFTEQSIQRRTRTSHISIPAAYKGGVTLVLLKESVYCAELVSGESIVGK